MADDPVYCHRAGHDGHWMVDDSNSFIGYSSRLDEHAAHQQLPKLALSNVKNNPEDAASNYAVASTVLSGALKRKAKIDIKAVDALSSTLGEQGNQHSGLPEYWKLASLLIDTRDNASSTDQKSVLPNCLDHAYVTGAYVIDRQTGAITFSRLEDPSSTVNISFKWSGCSLRLDQPDFWKTNVGDKILRERKLHPLGVNVSILLSDGVISYGGGSPIPISSVAFTNCRYNVAFPNVPPPTIQQIGIQLLTADLSNIHLELNSLPNPT